MLTISTRRLDSGTVVLEAEAHAKTGPARNAGVVRLYTPTEPDREPWVQIQGHPGRGLEVNVDRLDSGAVSVAIGHTTLFVTMAQAAELLDGLRRLDGIDDESKAAAAGDALDAAAF